MPKLVLVITKPQIVRGTNCTTTGTRLNLVIGKYIPSFTNTFRIFLLLPDSPMFAVIGFHILTDTRVKKKRKTQRQQQQQRKRQ